MLPSTTTLYLAEAASKRGGEVDALLWLFATVCCVALVIVHVGGFVAWLGRRSRFGKPVAWSVAAALGLLGLFIISEYAWEDLKAGRLGDADAEVQRVLVIGEQFAWSVIEPGPDGQLGSYLVWPQPTDQTWPDGKSFAGVPGPIDLPPGRRDDTIARYREVVDPIGKDFADPLGRDDVYQSALSRSVVVTAGRPVEVTLQSKDVIHDFFVPAMRTKMDVVPGMKGVLRFTPTTPGTYQILCAEFCGWGHTTMVAELIVEASP